MSQSSAADGIKMLPKSDLVGKNQESRDDAIMVINRDDSVIIDQGHRYK
jgi:hypothetical protein